MLSSESRNVAEDLPHSGDVPFECIVPSSDVWNLNSVRSFPQVCDWFCIRVRPVLPASASTADPLKSDKGEGADGLPGSGGNHCRESSTNGYSHRLLSALQRSATADRPGGNRVMKRAEGPGSRRGTGDVFRRLLSRNSSVRSVPAKFRKSKKLTSIISVRSSLRTSTPGRLHQSMSLHCTCTVRSEEFPVFRSLPRRRN